MEAFLSIRTHFAAPTGWPRPPSSSQAENEADLYGKCARPHGHGHNYLLDATVRARSIRVLDGYCDLAVLQQLVKQIWWWSLRSHFLN